MHQIGVLKAAGYTSSQITMCYIAEYAFIALAASFFGTLFPIPVFGFVRQVFSTLTGFQWTFGINPAAAFVSVLFITICVLLMVRLSCGKIKKMPPVEALRGGIAANSFRRNFFPLSRGIGNIHLRLGLKNMFAYFKLYAMIGVIMAGISVTVTIIFVMFYNFVVDQSTLLKMIGIETGDISLTVTPHTDADAFAIELEKMPEVRKTSMMDVQYLVVNGYDVSYGIMSNDYEQMENLRAHDGRLPKYDNELAIPKRFANMLGKGIGDSVMVKAKGVSQEYIITGHYSSGINGGQVAAITLAGYQRLDPNARRNNINIYFNDGVNYDAFSEKLKSMYGMLNVYRQEENSEYAAAKARAEEKISTYLEKYAIDSVEYAISYNGRIIISGSSSAYQIQSIVDQRESFKASMSNSSASISAIMQLISLVSLVILSLILSMTVRSIVAKRRHELGILKSSGFTTKQLARQLAVSFMPVAGTAVIAGCIIGAISASPILGVMLAATGLYNASFAVSPIAVTVIGALALLVTYTVANISAKRIKHVSVYELLSE